MYFDLLLLTLNLPSYLCYTGYDMFSGFNHLDENVDDEKSSLTHRSTKFVNLEPTTSTVLPTSAVKEVTESKFICPEKEIPQNIGPYEVPSQRDLVLLIRKTLKKMFNSYHRKALFFLKDIKQATLATSNFEAKCHGDSRKSYSNCVKKISGKCEIITKDLVISLESQRRDVANFSENTICNIEQMKADPIELIKTLAMETVSLEFALPGYLRLLSSCSTFCNSSSPNFTSARKPNRHMTDQDLVVKHFLTKKNYIELLQGLK